MYSRAPKSLFRSGNGNACVDFWLQQYREVDAVPGYNEPNCPREDHLVEGNNTLVYSHNCGK
jgi:hypothetical protein